MGGDKYAYTKNKYLIKWIVIIFLYFYVLINLLLMAIPTSDVKGNRGYLLIFIQKVLK